MMNAFVGMSYLQHKSHCLSAQLHAKETLHKHVVVVGETVSSYQVPLIGF